MTTNRMPGTASSTASSLSSSLMPAIRVKKEEEGEEESPLVVTSSSAATAAVSISSMRIRQPKKEEQDEAGGCHRHDGVFRGMKKEEDTEDDPQNSMHATTVPSLLSSSSTVPDHIFRSSSSNNRSNCSDTYWRTGDWCWVVEDEAHSNDDKEEADAEKSIESNTGPAIVVPSSLVAVKKEEQEVMTPRQQPLQIVARSKATDPTRLDHIPLRPRRTKTRKPRMKQEEEQQQNHDGPTNKTNISKPTAAVVSDQIVSNNNNNRDDDDTNDAVDDAVAAAVVTGTNRKRKSNHYSRDHLKRRKSKSSVQANNNNSASINLDDDDTNDGIVHNDDGDDGSYIRNNDNDDDYESENENLNDDDDNEWKDDNNGNKNVVVTNDTPMNKRSLKWMEVYDRLVEYKDQYGSTCVPTRYEIDRQLGVWVASQRENCKLSVDRRNLLNSIGFVWNAPDAKWTEMYERLVAYKEKYGSTCVPARYEIDRQLGVWVFKQRQGYNNTGNRKLSVDRRNLLNSIGFDWNARDAKWTEMYARLVAYKEQNGSTCLPARYEIDRQLEMWVSHQRNLYNTNELAKERINHLNSIDFVWNARDVKWTKMYERLVAYKEQNGSTCVPQSYKADKKLGRWVNTLRTTYNANSSRLTAAKKQQLRSIGFVWKVKK